MQQPVDQAAAERISGSQAVDHVDLVGWNGDRTVPGPAEHARGPLLDDRQLHAEIEQRVGGLLRVRSPTAISHSSRLPTATVTWCQGALDLLGGRRRGLPRTWAGSPDRAPSAGARASQAQAAKCAVRLGSSDGPVTVDQYSRAARTASASICRADLQIRADGLR